MTDVAQADRNAAARFYRGAEIGIPGLDKSIREGRRDDDELVQAFARHRSLNDEGARDLRDALKDLLPFVEAERLAEEAQVRVKAIHRMPVRGAIRVATAALAKFEQLP